MMSATAWKCTKTGKLKMGHFSGIKFAGCLAKETRNPLPSHTIRRKRTRRPLFSLDAQEENHPFSHCQYSDSFRSPLTPVQVSESRPSAPCLLPCSIICFLSRFSD